MIVVGSTNNKVFNLSIDTYLIYPGPAFSQGGGSLRAFADDSVARMKRLTW